MLQDDKAPTPAQQHQITFGHSLAVNAALHALIATHPNPRAFSAVFEQCVAETNRMLLLPTALKGDDGLRQSYGEALRMLRAAIPQG